jgi:hypothetical protein
MTGPQTPSAASLLNPKGSKGCDSPSSSASSSHGSILNTPDSSQNIDTTATNPSFKPHRISVMAPYEDRSLATDHAVDSAEHDHSQSSAQTYKDDDSMNLSNWSADRGFVDVGPAAKAGKSPAPSKGLTFNPAQLLNPRQKDPQATKVRPEKHESEGSVTNGTPMFEFGSTHNGDDSEDDGGGMGNLIERAHNLTAREDQPAKRQKVEHDGEKKGLFAKVDIRAGGIISDHIKEKRREAQKNQGLPIIQIDDTPEPDAVDSRVVDLTVGQFIPILILLRT